MIGLGRWVVAGLAALGAGAAAALISRRRRDDGEHDGRPHVAPPPTGGAVDQQQAALDEARARLRKRADEVKAQLERDSD